MFEAGRERRTRRIAASALKFLAPIVVTKQISNNPMPLSNII